jgi:tetratricopeptide (TPR) repeat protein
LIVKFYSRYLDDQDASALMKDVSIRYSLATIEGLASRGTTVTRRAAVLALGLVGDFTSNATLGRALVDPDRVVRTLADRSIRNVWWRTGDPKQQQALCTIMRLNAGKQCADAVRMANDLIRQSPSMAEAWNQRALAHHHLEKYGEAIADFHQALEINPYHFAAAAGMGQSYLKQGNPMAALQAFRRALRLNPTMRSVRAQVIRLQRTLNEE